MRKLMIILAVLVVIALGGTVSAYQTITFPHDGNIVVTYVSTEASYHNDFGIWSPTFEFLGRNNEATTGTQYTGQSCVEDEPVALYIRTPENPPNTYRSDIPGDDTYDHANVIAEADGSYTVQFENQYGLPPSSDRDFNDVVLNVACIPPNPPPVPEFPTMALPAALIIGLLGAVLFVKRTKEN